VSENIENDVKNDENQEDGTVVLKKSNSKPLKNFDVDDATQLAQGKRRTAITNKKDTNEIVLGSDRTRVRSRLVNLPVVENDATQIAAGMSISKADMTSETSGASLTDAIHRTNQEVQGLKSKNRRLKIINQRFLLASKLGVGGMGTVYRAKDLRKVEAQDKNPWVAVKLLNDAFKEHPSAFIALQREAQKSQKLAHPNIVRVYDFDRDGETVFMTMELLRGEDLNHIIKRNKKGFKQEDALNIIRQVGGALAEAHKHNIVHSDFKPGNIFYTTSKVAKVFDFGIARAVSEIGTGPMALGDVNEDNRDHTMFDASTLNALTPAYASKEMHNGHDACKSDDVYALGCVAYEVLTGRHPYGKIPANKVTPKQVKLPAVEGLKRRQVKALQKSVAIERKDRYETVDEFLNDFLPERNKLGRGAKLVLAALVLALCGSGVLYYQQQQEILMKEQALLKEQQRIQEEQLASQKEIELENQRIAKERAQNRIINKAKYELDLQIEAYEKNATRLKKRLEDHAFVSSSSDSLEWQLSVGRNISSLENVYQETDWFSEFSKENAQDYLQPIIQQAESMFGADKLAVEKWLQNYYQKVSNVYLSQARDKVYIEDFSSAQKMIGLARQYDKDNQQIKATQALLTQKWEAQKSEDKEVLRQASLSSYKTKDELVTRQVNSCSEQLSVVSSSFTFDMNALQKTLSKMTKSYRLIPNEVTQGNVTHINNLGQCIRLFGETDPNAGKAVLLKAKALFPSYISELDKVSIRPFDSCSPAFAGKGRRYTCTDRLINDLAIRGPELVVVQSDQLGTYSMGKYEVTQGQMAIFCKSTGECEVPEEKDYQLPATDYSLALVDNYLQWLSKETGFSYRLPTYQEWLHAAKARNRELDINRNCQLDSRGLVKGTRLLPVDIGQANGWGLISHVGNAQEIVRDGDKYRSAGGSKLTPMESCNTLALQDYSPEDNDVTGFRVVRQMELIK
jgi:serine/threonine protein kinase